MKNAIRLAALAGMMCLQSMAADRYYLTNGSGSWADASRWSGGHVPESGDVVRITNGTARVTAADTNILAKIASTVVVNKDDVLEFDLDVDYRHPTRIIGKGKIVKNGSGALYLDEKFSKLYYTDGGMEVNDGELHLVEVTTTDKNEFMYGPFTVNAPGKLFLRPGGASYTPGISGDGVITNTSTTALELNLITNSTVNAGRTYSFSGVVSPNVPLTFTGTERQDMLVDNPYGLTIRAASGVIGVKKFGNAGAVGSIGTANNIWINSSSAMEPPCFLYLGDGETTTKSFRMNTSPRGVVFDGGANGGLTLTGDFYLTRNLNGKMTQLILDGSNTTVCTFASKALEYTADATVATHIVKRGTGTWRLNAVSGSELRGGITVEKGTLEAQTIANAGTLCALGKATVRQSAYWGDKDASKNVPWAILLGDGTVPGDLMYAGTLSYVGTSAVDCSTRLIALNGAGRLRNDSATTLTWSGITSSCAGDHALVLAGSGTSDTVYCVTNGPGRITVVKEGSGTWTLDRDLDVSGFDVRGGTLDVRMSRQYVYYRFNVKDLWGDGQTMLQITRVALFAEDGTCRNLNLAKNGSAAESSISALREGEFAFWTSGYTENRPLEHLFQENSETPSDVDLCAVYRTSVVPALDDDSTWIRFVMRPVHGSPITRYDICSGTVKGSNGTPYIREIKSWSIEGSQDGVTWKELSAVTNNPTAVMEKEQWYSSRSSAYTTGYAIEPEGNSFVKNSSIDFIAVASDGTLKVDSPVTVRGIKCDVAAGGGTVQGFEFPSTGELRVTGVGSDMAVLPITFADCTGLANLPDWTLYIDGRLVTSRRIRMTSGGQVYVTSRGFFLSFR